MCQKQEELSLTAKEINSGLNGVNTRETECQPQALVGTKSRKGMLPEHIVTSQREHSGPSTETSHQRCY